MAWTNISCHKTPHQLYQHQIMIKVALNNENY